MRHERANSAHCGLRPKPNCGPADQMFCDDLPVEHAWPLHGRSMTEATEKSSVFETVVVFLTVKAEKWGPSSNACDL
jgi:hypothetical protein